MDKIRNEFETQALNMGHSVLKIDGQYIESLTVILHTGYLMGQQSRDEEIKKLREVLEEIHEVTRHGYNALFAAKISEKALKD